MVANNLNNGNASFPSPYPAANVPSSIAISSQAAMIVKNNFPENGSNAANIPLTKMNTSQPSNLDSQQPPSAAGKRLAPIRLDQNMVPGTTMGIEPINIGVTPTDIKLLSDMSSSGMIPIKINRFYFLYAMILIFTCYHFI